MSPFYWKRFTVPKNRVIPGMITYINSQLRIINGNLESLRKLRKPGRPKKTENMVQPDYVPIFPQKEDLRDSAVRNGFRLVRHQARKLQIAEENRALQARFDALCSPVTILRSTTENTLRFDSVSRIEEAVPETFCSCDPERLELEEMPCLIHGFDVVKIGVIQ